MTPELHYVQPINERQDNGPEEKDRPRRGCVQRLKMSTAPRDGSSANLAAEGHVLGAETDVGWNCRTLPWASVMHQAWLVGSRCGLGPWREAKAHTATGWPWPPSAGLQRPLLRPECGCRRWAGAGAKSVGWGWELGNLVGSQPSLTLDTPSMVWSPRWKKCS